MLAQSPRSNNQQQTYRQDSVSSGIGDVSPHAYLLDSVPAVSALCPFSQNILTCKPECVIGVGAVSPQPTTNLPVRQGVSAVLALCPRSLPQTYLQDIVYQRCWRCVPTHLPTRQSVTAVVALCPTHLPTRQNVPAVVALCLYTLTYKTECTCGVSAVSHTLTYKTVYLRW